jgi:hypothetical protein
MIEITKERKLDLVGNTELSSFRPQYRSENLNHEDKNSSNSTRMREDGMSCQILLLITYFEESIPFQYPFRRYPKEFVTFAQKEAY